MTMANDSYIYETPDGWGETTYGNEAAMLQVVEGLKDLGEEWEDVSLGDCWEWRLVNGDIYEEAGARHETQAKFKNIGDGYYEFVEYLEN